MREIMDCIMGKNGMKCFAFFCTLLLLAAFAQAMSIGAGPSDIEFDNVLKGGYAERVVTVSTAGDEDLTITVEVMGDITGWISIKPSNTFNLPPKGRTEIAVVLQPPVDAANGEYSGSLYIRASPVAVITEGTGASVGGAVKIGLTAEVTGDEVVDYKLSEVRVSDTEIGFPIRFNVSVKNKGNVKVSPTIHIEIFDRLKKNLLKVVDYTDLTVLPTITESVVISVPTKGLEVGKHVATISSDLGGSASVEFNIMAPGTLAMKGLLSGVSVNKHWVQVGELVEVNGLFLNRGELLIEGAKLKGQVYLVSEDFKTEKLVEVFESDMLNVPVNSQQSFKSYFKPTSAGRYVVRGSVIYQGKETRKKETILNVLPQEKNYTLYYIGVGVLVIVLVYFLLMKSEDGRTRRFKKLWGDYLQIK